MWLMMCRHSATPACRVELQTKLPEDYYEGPTTAQLLAECAYYIELPHLRDY